MCGVTNRRPCSLIICQINFPARLALLGFINFTGDFSSDKVRFFSPHKVFHSAQSDRFILVGVVQMIRQIVDICFRPCYPLLQIRSLHLHKVSIRFYLPPRSHPDPFCRHSSTTKSFARRIFYFLIDLQPGNRFAILVMHLENCISRPDWIQSHDSAEMRASLTTPLQNRGRNLIRGERRPHKQETSRFKFALPAFETEFVLLFGFSKLTEKAESKYRPVATISQIEIASHAPVVLVGECLPQTLLIFRAPRDLRLYRFLMRQTGASTGAIRACRSARIAP